MKQREGSRWIKERKNKKGRLLCLVPTCKNLREKYKKSDKLRNYCKKHGFEDMQPFTSWPALREKAFKRDNYTCVKCGDNRKEIYDFSYITTNLIGDHIIPIALGGEEFDIDNIQTLCIKCNKIKTKKDAKKIAKLRRKENGNNK